MAEEKVSELLAKVRQTIVEHLAAHGPDIRPSEAEAIIADAFARRTHTPVTEDVGEPFLTGRGLENLSCYDQFTLATQIAANIGYELVAEAEHPDSPHARAHSLYAKADGPGEDGWQPIETAPKDGTRLLACWDINELSYGVVWWEDGSWVEYDADNRVSDPTHWRPLPVSPSIKREA